MKQRPPLRITRGSNFRYIAKFTNLDGTDKDVSTHTYAAYIRDTFDDEVLVYTFTPSTVDASQGLVYLPIDQDETIELKEGNYVARFLETVNGFTWPVWDRGVVVVS